MCQMLCWDLQIIRRNSYLPRSEHIVLGRDPPLRYSEIEGGRRYWGVLIGQPLLMNFHLRNKGEQIWI